MISIDQSLSNCAITWWKEDTPVYKRVVQTGSIFSKEQKKCVRYFPIITQQIDFICNEIVSDVLTHGAKIVVLEKPASNAFGNAKSALGILFRAINETLLYKTNLTSSDIVSYSPTSVKSFARGFLPEEEQTINGKKLKMEKKHMVRACQVVAPDGWLDGLTLAEGRADFADSFWIGYKYLKERSIESN